MTNKKTNNLNQTKKPSFVSPKPDIRKSPGSSLRLGEKTVRLLPYLYIIMFVALAVNYLILQNTDMLYMAQSHNLFQETPEYLHDCMKQPGGLLTWAGTYLTQYFYIPTVGAGMLIALWVLTFFVTIYAFRIKNAWSVLIVIPVISLLCSTIATGYWVYYMKCPGYWFAPSLGFLTAVLSVLLTRVMSEKVKLAWILVWSIAGYIMIGYFALMSVLYICLDYVINEKDKRMNAYVLPLTAVVISVITPLLCYRLYNNMRLEDAWLAAFPILSSGSDVSYMLEIPFAVTTVTPFLFVFFCDKAEKETEIKGKKFWLVALTTIAVISGSVYITDKVNFDDDNFHHELRMYRAVEDNEWNDVLQEMGEIKDDATRVMVLFKNIALLNTGHMGDRLFAYNNMGKMPYSFDSLKVHMVQTAASLIYYNHGKTNFAYRWAIENSVEFGYNIDNLKTLVRSSIVNEEWDAAKKYLSILKETKFHKEWAAKYDNLIKNPKTIGEYHEFDIVRELRNNMGSVLDGDNGMPEMYLLNYFSNTMNKDSKVLQELTLAYALIQKDIQLFWPRFFLYAQMHKGDAMPRHYQEAAYLYGKLEPFNVDISGMPFDKQNVIDRYNSFQDMSQQLLNEQRQRTGTIDSKKVGEAMKPLFGDTFYWFYFFCRDIKSN